MVNYKAKSALSKLVKEALNRERLSMHVIGSSLGISPSFVSSVKSGDFDENSGELDILCDTLGIPPKMVDAVRRPAPQPKPAEQSAGNVIDFRKHKEKWQKTSLSEMD